MDVTTAEIRYQRWVQVIHDWSKSGLSKRDYCQQNAIDEKQFYYYQRRIQGMEPDGSAGRKNQEESEH